MRVCVCGTSGCHSPVCVHRSRVDCAFSKKTNDHQLVTLTSSCGHFVASPSGSETDGGLEEIEIC